MVQSTTNYVCLQIHDKLFTILSSPLDVKNCGPFCLHGVFGLREGGGVRNFRQLHCKCGGELSQVCLLSICLYLFTIHQVREKRRKKDLLSFRKIGHIHLVPLMMYCSIHTETYMYICIMMLVLVAL